MPVVLVSRFSAVVVSFHTGPVLDACLAALLSDPLCSQVVLVNNGNPDDVLAALARFVAIQPKMTLLDGHGNIGFGRGCNLGAKAASENLLVFVNPDCVIDPQTLTVLAQTLALHPSALVGGALRNENGSEQRGCRRGELTLWSALVSFLGLGRPGAASGIWRDFNRTSEPEPKQSVQMPVVSGALMAISRVAFDSVGGFDPAFFLHVEDIDLCRRIREGGGYVMFEPNAKARHIGATSSVSSWAVERAKIKSFGHYFWKNAQTPWAQASVSIVMPVLAAAILVRLALRRGFKNEAPPTQVVPPPVQ